MKLRRGDWIATFAFSIATLWMIAAIELQTDLPMAFPSRERLCGAYARAADMPGSAPPGGRATAFEAGPPYWATWVEERPESSPDGSRGTYAACVDEDTLFARAELRLRQDWGVWFEENAGKLALWLISPFLVAPMAIVIVVMPYVQFRRWRYRREKAAAARG